MSRLLENARTVQVAVARHRGAGEKRVAVNHLLQNVGESDALNIRLVDCLHPFKRNVDLVRDFPGGEWGRNVVLCGRLYPGLCAIQWMHFKFD